MTSNDIIFLNSLLQEKKTNFQEYDDSEFFELFCFEQILKDFDLSYEELAFGNVDDGSDGGIDGFFFFINKEYAGDGYAEGISLNATASDTEDVVISPINDDFRVNIKNFSKDALLELYIIQAKGSNSFGENVFDRVLPTLKDLFDFSKSYDELRSFYNQNLLEKAFLFRKFYLQSSVLHPSLKITFVYASKGDSSKINERVINRGEILRQDILSYFSSVEVSVEYLGARELLTQSRIEKNYTLSLNFISNYLSGGENSYILLSKLTEYYKFITDESGSMKKYIFDSNVRDYQGNVAVNKDIRATLDQPDVNLDFWWLNNGITILASRASIVGKTISLDDVQIINGLQTTYSIYNYFRDNPDATTTENRSISIKIIVIDQNLPQTRDKIIKATNFQTAIQPYSLRATDQIQRDIESYFGTKGWFYDRRKNYYKNIDKPANRIVSIQNLSQAYMSIILRKPQSARSNPVSLIQADGTYNRIFNENVDPDVYIFCAKFMKTIESYLRRKSLQDWKIVKYHIAMFSLMKHFESKNYTPNDLVNLLRLNPEPLISDTILDDTLQQIRTIGSNYIALGGGDFTTLTKTKEFTNYIEASFSLNSNH